LKKYGKQQKKFLGQVNFGGKVILSGAQIFFSKIRGYGYQKTQNFKQISKIKLTLYDKMRLKKFC
jgi:hypothetical protein